MTIDNNCGQEDGTNDSPVSQAEAHSQLALEQSALYAAKLAIARWINTSSQAAASIAPAADLARANWYAQAQCNFQEWLGRGGFAQYEIAADELAEASPPIVGLRAERLLITSATLSTPTCID